ncbi:MAG: CmcJ/NvfI family oxidoreductase [Steroidobacteraceae bacterium]
MNIQLRHVLPGAGKPRAYTFDPPPGEPEISADFEMRTVEVRDLRPLAGQLSLDREGFQLAAAPTRPGNFDDAEWVRRVCYPDTTALLLRITGATRALVFDHTVRRRDAHAPRRPVYNAHVDFTAVSGPRRVRELLRGDPAELTRRRHAIINVWRPIVGPLHDAPLALADAASVAPRDLVPTDLVYPDRIGEYYLLQYNPSQRWYYAPAMQAHEALLLKNYDSAGNGPARFSPHAAFDEPGSPADAPARASIELRALVFY